MRNQQQLHGGLATYVPWHAPGCLPPRYDCTQVQESQAAVSCAGKSASARGRRRGRS